jgi:oligopeptide transport system permease protein
MNDPSDLMSTGFISTVHGISPMQTALDRLYKNKGAMFGAAVVVLICAMVILAPLLTSHQPDLQRLWLGAQGPFFSHPDCLRENTFALGRRAETIAAALSARTIEITVDESQYREYRIVPSREGHVRSIMAKNDAIEQMDLPFEKKQEIKIKGLEALKLDGLVRIEFAKGLLGPNIAPLWLQKGKPAPPNFFHGRQGVIIKTAEHRVFATYSIVLNDDIVVSIRKNGQYQSACILNGTKITALLADGRPLVSRHLLGTDKEGRDLWARILYGGRISLLVGLTATMVSLIIGVIYGALSGYIGGRTDRLMMSGIDVLYGLPFMFLVILLLSFFGNNVFLLFMALGAVQWLTMARIVRGQVLSLKQKDFIHAAMLSGCSNLKVIFRHLIPNCLGPVIVYATLTVPIVILEESFLAFIGLSIQHGGRRLDSWGALVKYGVDNLGTYGTNSWLLLWPAGIMALMLLALNMLGDGLRDAFDPELKGR